MTHALHVRDGNKKRLGNRLGLHKKMEIDMKVTSKCYI